MLIAYCRMVVPSNGQTRLSGDSRRNKTALKMRQRTSRTQRLSNEPGLWCSRKVATKARKTAEIMTMGATNGDNILEVGEMWGFLKMH